MDTDGKELYRDEKIPFYGQVLVMILFTILFGVPIFLMTERCYPIKVFEMRMRLMREYINTCKEAAKLKLKVEAAAEAEAGSPMPGDKVKGMDADIK